MDEETVVTTVIPANDTNTELENTLSLVLERQTEISEGVNECRTNLSNLSTQVTAENPVLSQLVAGQMEIRSQLGSLNQSISDLKQSTLRPPESTPAPPEIAPEPVLIETDVLMDEPRPDVPHEQPEKRRKFRLL